MYTSDKKKAVEYADLLIRYSFLYLVAAIFCALFGAVYEVFSHEVYSFFMIYAFAIPLILGAFPLLYIALRAKKQAEKEETGEEDVVYASYYTENESEAVRYAANLREDEKNAARYIAYLMEKEENPESSDDEARKNITEAVQKKVIPTESITEFRFPGSFSLNAWGSGIAALTVGSIFRGVLDIYGTTNRLVVVYPVVGGIMMAAGLISFCIFYMTVDNMRRRKMAI